MEDEEINAKIAAGGIAKHVQTICDTVAMPLMHKLVLRQAERILNDQSAEITRLRAERDVAQKLSRENALQMVAAQKQSAQLRAALDAMTAERDAAMEAAAVKVESLWAYRTCAEVAAAIRAMKEKI